MWRLLVAVFCVNIKMREDVSIFPPNVQANVYMLPFCATRATQSTFFTLSLLNFALKHGLFWDGENGLLPSPSVRTNWAVSSTCVKGLVSALRHHTVQQVVDYWKPAVV